MINYYTREEVKIHNKLDDCWIISNNKVYDVTEYLKINKEHVERIMEFAGCDVSRHFNFHTIAQQRIWKSYNIGHIKTNHNTLCCICS